MMQAIEFEAHLENGYIQLPSSFQHWQDGKQVKVIVLIDESIQHNLPHKKKSINDYAGKISLSLDALEFQNKIRDEWA